MNSRTLKLLAVALASSLLFSGCANVTQGRVETDSATAAQQIDMQRAQLKNSIVQAEFVRINAQEVRKPFIAGNSQPLAREVAVPEILRKPTPITALFSRNPVDFPVALRQLSEATGLSITATPDALLPPSAFASRAGAAQASPVAAPLRVTLQAQDKQIWAVLDDVARQASVSWRPVEGGAEFYRVETKLFYLSGANQVASTKASLGRAGGTNTAFSSESKTEFEIKDQNLIRGVYQTVEALLSVGGKVTIGSEGQTLVVTDSKAALDRVESYIKEQNKSMSRRVRILVEAIEVVDKDSSEKGVDWSILMRRANDVLTISPIASLVSSQAGGINFFDTNTNSQTNGSSLIVKALNEVGTVVNRSSFPLLVTSGRPVTTAIRTTFNYVDQVQATSVASSTQTAQAPTVAQKDETVGTFLTLTPTAKNDGTIFLSIFFDVTSAGPLTPFTVGSGNSAVTVQQKTIDGSGVIQEVPIRSGQTVVIGGIERQTSQSTGRRLGAGAPILFGGSDSSKVTKTRTVLLVTAVTEEGV